MIKDNAKKIYENIKKTGMCKAQVISSSELKLFKKYLIFAMFSDFFFEKVDENTIIENLIIARNHLKKALGSRYEENEDKIERIFDKLASIREELLLDAEAIFDGDPACKNIEDVIIVYPGFYAISTYRIAHEFYKEEMFGTARILSEIAHSKTGVDINPGATIGKYFFIDHGTGVVIGETSVIGEHCKIYQGVTLGALSLRKGRQLSETKRHPTLLNNVTIYSGASIFGGDTIIGNNVTIGSNVEIKESIPDNSVIKGNCGK